MAFVFKKAQKSKAKLRMAIDGATGSGKTFTALALAAGLGGKTLVVDTEGGESGSANKYADKFDFDHVTLTTFHPATLTSIISQAMEENYDNIVIDSMSHFWTGKEGVLDQVDNIAKRQRTGNSFTAWKEGTPIQRAMMDSILHSNLHVICTMRSKMDYILEVQEKNGRTYQVPKRVGMAPIQRDDVTYEFDIVGDMDKGEMIINKTRCSDLTDAVIKHPGKELAETIKAWLSDGVEVEKDEPEARDHEGQENGAVGNVGNERERVGGGGDVDGGAKAAVPRYVTLLEESKNVQPDAEDAKPVWSNGLAGKLRHARESLATKLGKPEVSLDVTRAFIRAHFGLESHKELNQAQVDALFEWMRECYNQGRIVG